MTPTAEDILNQNKALWAAADKIIIAIRTGTNRYEYEDSFWEELKEEWFDYLKKVAEEYSLLKSKEAADKAWEAAGEYEYRSNFGKVPTDVPNKETFMKELFKQ